MVISLPRDSNRITVIGGTSSVDGVSPVTIYVDPSTHRLKVDASSTANIIIGTSTITGGTDGRVLYDNAGVLGEMTNTGSGTVNVLQTSPTLTTPVLGIATATSINKVTITAPATSSTLTIADGKTLTVSNSGTLSGGDAFVLAIAAGKTLTVSNTLTFTGTDSSSVAFGAGGTVLYNGGALGTPSSGVATNLTGTAASLTAGTVTTNANLTGAITSSGNATSLGSFSSASLSGALTDETGTGAAVFAGSPTFTGKPVVNNFDNTGATYTPSSGSQTVALDCASNNMHIVTGNSSGTAITFTIANATNNQPFIVSVLQSGGTLSTIAGWFATVRWAGGVTPTLTATLSKRDTFGFIRTGANTYDGFIIGQNC